MAVGSYAVASDTGRRRRRNEDNYVVAPPLFAVADGMGGAQAGEVASSLAASALEAGTSEELGGPERVAALIQEANRRIFARASTDPTASGMGTTMTVALVEGMTVVIGHVGDSRAYLVRGDSMEQLTEDHSLVNELVKSGELTAEEAQIHPQRSVITRAVGTDPDVDVDVFTVAAEDGDVFLLCSDGLTDMVADVDILDLVDRNRGDLEEAVRALVRFANKEGGEDNITAVAFRIAAAAERSRRARRHGHDARREREARRGDRGVPGEQRDETSEQLDDAAEPPDEAAEQPDDPPAPRRRQWWRLSR